jgi:hypothetical protein
LFLTGSGHESDEESIEKEKPNYKPSGLLLKELKTNSRGIEAKYVEPADAAPPKLQWRLYSFKNNTALGMSAVQCVRESECVSLFFFPFRFFKLKYFFFFDGY